MKKLFAAAALALTLLSATSPAAETNAPPATGPTNAQSRLLRPLALAEALDIALQQNSAIRKSAADLEATYGLAVQTRAIALPRLGVNSSYSANEDSATDRFPTTVPISTPGGGTANFNLGNVVDFADQRWAADIRVVQSIYEGGKINAALRTARLLRERALLNHQTIIADALLAVRVGYYNVLAAQQEITVQEAALKLAQQELDEMQRRFNAGTVPRFNVLRAEVTVANVQPKLIRVRNTFRTSKDRLANLLGEKLPREMEEAPMQLTDKLEAAPLSVSLPDALAKAFEQRTEIAAVRKTEALRTEAIANAKSGYKPSVQVFAGYGAKSSQFSTDLTDELHGWEAGAQLSWSVFDGFLTKGRVLEAKALQTRTQEELADVERSVELDVRTAYSSFMEAQEVLRSQEKVQESAEESLRLANVRANAGAATQLDVLNAQTALTEARTTEVLALHNYATARARLQRAVGQPFATEGKR
jgi:outer membrane protein TolC